MGWRGFWHVHRDIVFDPQFRRFRPLAGADGAPYLNSPEPLSGGQDGGLGTRLLVMGQNAVGPVAADRPTLP